MKFNKNLVQDKKYLFVLKKQKDKDSDKILQKDLFSYVDNLEDFLK